MRVFSYLDRDQLHALCGQLIRYFYGHLRYQQDLIIETKTNITPTKSVSEILINSVGEEIRSKTAKEPSTAHTASSTLKPTREELKCAID